VTQVVMLRMGDLVIGVPANLIEMVRRVPAADLERAYRDDVFEFSGEQVPFYWAGALLQASVNSSETRTKTLPVAIFRSGGSASGRTRRRGAWQPGGRCQEPWTQLSRLPAWPACRCWHLAPWS